MLAVSEAACSRSGLDLPVDVSVVSDPGSLPIDQPEPPPFKDDPEQARADRIDLLFVIDDSGSMSDKQALLVEAVPDMLARLTRPRCVDASGQAVAVQPGDPEAPCPLGSAREFNRVQDMHVGVVTSSVATQGGCMIGFGTPGRGHLVPPDPAYAYAGQPFIAWDPEGVKDPPGLADPARLQAALSDLIARGEGGCPDEAPLEAFYRFLIEPEPPAAVEVLACDDNRNGECLIPKGVDRALLAEREAFLRDDSLLAIIVLTDENDCSLAPFSDGHRFISDGAGRPRATSQCAATPDDRCCQPCDAPPVPGCPSPSRDPECQRGPYGPEEDPPLLRCWDQKRRFGVDRRYPIERYRRGLRDSTVPSGLQGQAANPIFAARSQDGTPMRDPSLVFFASIVGVPWQDLAEDPFDERRLRYQSAAELRASGSWENVVGSFFTDFVPTDPLMRESLVERTGVHPVLGVPLAPSTSVQRLAHPINGHEMDLFAAPEIDFRSDLQYACIFALAEPRNCGEGDISCDCSQAPARQRKPICQGPDGRYSDQQWAAKAYPGLRQLRLAAALEDHAVAASICARNVDDRRRQDFGYRPAIDALVDRLRLGLN